MKILHVVGARPNFMKIAPVIRALREHPQPFDQILIHTGQHYDDAMSQVFFDELDLPRPEINLEVGSGSHAWQTAGVMQAIEPVLLEQNPDWVVVVGDVNSTLAAALVCAKLGLPVAHVEAGLRSFDRTMPEEINRLLTDQVSSLLFTPSPDGDANLLREGIDPGKIHRVGNVMIDTLVRLLSKAETRWSALAERLPSSDYLLVTLHRPQNVDEPGPLGEIIAALDVASRWLPVILPLHPRTRRALEVSGLAPQSPGVHLWEPLGYLDFLALEAHARLVLTDSGGVQEETTYLGIPCLTVRPNTERPITITQGTNQLVAARREPLLESITTRLLEPDPALVPPELWDGEAARRIAAVFAGLD